MPGSDLVGGWWILLFVVLAIFLKSVFQHVLKVLSDASWTRFWTSCWAYVGSFFELFSAIKMRSYLEVVLALIFHRFKTPSNLKN